MTLSKRSGHRPTTPAIPKRKDNKYPRSLTKTASVTLLHHHHGPPSATGSVRSDVERNHLNPQPRQRQRQDPANNEPRNNHKKNVETSKEWTYATLKARSEKQKEEKRNNGKPNERNGKRLPLPFVTVVFRLKRSPQSPRSCPVSPMKTIRLTLPERSSSQDAL